MSMKFKNKEEYIEAYQKFFESHPEAPVAEDIECLNLIMRREYAEQILAGTKKLEFRSYSDFYIKRLIDQDVYEYIGENLDNEDVRYFCNDIRQVKKIHFHNYNNSWFLDVECTFNDVFSITKEDVKMLNEKYDCHDYDDDLERLEAFGVEKRPFIFYFVCGKVLDTNLESKPKDEEYVGLCGGLKYDIPGLKEALNGEQNKDVITFRVEKEVFEDIISGNQRFFQNEIRPSNVSQFFITNEKGKIKEINGVPQFRRYDAVQFIYKEKSYTCLINNADIIYWDMEYCEAIPYSELDDDVDYTDCMIEYVLGDEVKQK